MTRKKRDFKKKLLVGGAGEEETGEHHRREKKGRLEQLKGSLHFGLGEKEEDAMVLGLRKTNKVADWVAHVG